MAVVSVGNAVCKPKGAETIEYPVKRAPPFDTGGVQEITALRTAATAVTPVGAEGVVLEDSDVPFIFVAVTVNVLST